MRCHLPLIQTGYRVHCNAVDMQPLWRLVCQSLVNNRMYLYLFSHLTEYHYFNWRHKPFIRKKSEKQTVWCDYNCLDEQFMAHKFNYLETQAMLCQLYARCPSSWIQLLFALAANPPLWQVQRKASRPHFVEFLS